MDAYEMGREDGYQWDLAGFDSRDDVKAWRGWAGAMIVEAGDRFLADRWGVEPYGDGWYTALARYNWGAVEGALEQWDEAEACLAGVGR
jgi:hypothetical protein